MDMKRSREDVVREGLAMAKCLMLLSSKLEPKSTITSFTSQAFECKTCNRRFSSFQALGGHRASHKKPRLNGEDSSNDETKVHSREMKPKMSHYRCSICGLKFNTGQALGGHMRRHRVAIRESLSSSSPLPVAAVSKLPAVLKRSNSRKVVSLDLNLTPLENDLKLLFGKLAPKVDYCFI